MFRLTLADADMLMVGVFANPAAPSAGPPHSFEEWRSHFGACEYSCPACPVCGVRCPLSSELHASLVECCHLRIRVHQQFSTDSELQPDKLHNDGRSLAVYFKCCRHFNQPGVFYTVCWRCYTLPIASHFSTVFTQYPRPHQMMGDLCPLLCR